MPFDLLDLVVDEIGFVDKGAGIGVTVNLFKRRKTEVSVDRVALFFKTMALAGVNVPTLLKMFEGSDEALIKKMTPSEDVLKQATLDDIKAKLTVEEWEVILTALSGAAAPPGEETPGEATAAGEAEQDQPSADAPAPEEIAAQSGHEEEPEMPKTKALEKKLDDMEKARKADAEKITKLEKAARFAKYRTEATTLKYAHGSQDEIAKNLMAADDIADKEVGKSIRKSIEKSHEERKASRLLEPFGSGLPNMGEDATIHQQLTLKAGELMKVRKGRNDKPLTKAAAYQLACKENKELYNQMVAERRERMLARAS